MKSKPSSAVSSLSASMDGHKELIIPTYSETLLRLTFHVPHDVIDPGGVFLG